MSRFTQEALDVGSVLEEDPLTASSLTGIIIDFWANKGRFPDLLLVTTTQLKEINNIFMEDDPNQPFITSFRGIPLELKK